MRHYLIFLAFIFTGFKASSQYFVNRNDVFQLLEQRLSQGDKNALSTLGKYLKDTSTYIEYTMEGSFETTKSQKAKYIFESQTLFLPTEFNIKDAAEDFEKFFSKNKSRIYFDSITHKFLITSLSKRKSVYVLYKCDYKNDNTDSLIEEIKSYADKNIFRKFSNLYKQKDSRSLYMLASMCYINNPANLDNYQNLFASLANVFVQVKNENEKWVWRYEPDYQGNTRLNLLIYWANHFTDYKWNDQKEAFINTTEALLQKPPEIALFNKLLSGNDSTALNAFIRLTYYDSKIIEQLPFSSLEFNMNDKLPIFQFNFLKALGKYRQYFQNKKISLELAGRTKTWFDSLAEENISFKQRYQLENEVITDATPDEISALEFWFLVNEENWDLSYSAGRIIDKYYSYHWKEIINDTSQLNYYLKKAALFDGLGIIGNCNKYLFKFQHRDSATTDRLTSIYRYTNDADVAASVQKIFSGLKARVDTFSKSNDGNYNCSIDDLKTKYTELSSQPHESYENPIDKITACIGYDQIEDLINLLQQKNKLDSVYNFLYDDFGFPIELDSIGEREAFLKLYKDHPYREVCAFYLDTLGLDYKTKDGGLDYQKIYNILEFDNVDALSGGGGTHRQKGVFLIIRLLEFTFNTTLDFPEKSCNSAGIYYCDLIDRSQAWIDFLADRKLIMINNNMPSSISSLHF